MRITAHWRRSAARGAIAAIAGATVMVSLAACASGSSETSSSPAPSSVDLEAAKAYLQPYTEAPTTLPVSESLAKLPPPGARIVFLDIGTPNTAQAWQLLQPVTDILDVKLERVQTGSTAESMNAALNTVVENPPAAVIWIAQDPTFFSSQLDALRAAGTVIVPSSIVDGTNFGFSSRETIFGGPEMQLEIGRALASAAVVKTDGDATQFVFYDVPELAFSSIVEKGAQEELTELCPGCTLRVVHIPVSQIGSTALQTIVSDLQANPQTQFFISALDEAQIGLPAAASVAGVDVPGIGAYPVAANYQQVQDGTETGTMAQDQSLFVWSLMDQALRGIAGQALTDLDVRQMASTVHHLVTEDNAQDIDPAAGYVAFPDYVARFTKLWTGK